MSEHWRYNECSVAFYHDGIETDMYKVVDALNATDAHIAELEAESDQLTAHYATERQDDKSPNDTQSSTIVYGKESD